MDNIYDFRFETQNALKEYGSEKLIQSEFFNKLQYMPQNTKWLLPGKLYAFRYKTERNALYDSFPYIMSMGQSKKNPMIFYGIDMRVIPLQIRLQVFGYIYDIFSRRIMVEIGNFPDIGDADKQNFIKEITTDTAEAISKKINIMEAVKKYDISKVSDCRIVNYNLIHEMVYCDEDYFENGSIADAQKKFTENINKKR